MQNLLSQPSLHFRHASNGVIYNTIWEELKNGQYKSIAPEHILKNALIDGVDRTQNKPVLKDYFPIHKGMLWNEEEKIPFDPIFIPNRMDVNMDCFLETSYCFFEQYKEKKIAVQLSGGLDSSIIIGLLKYFNIPFYLVGLTNQRFEFRTEKKIQNILAEWAQKTVLIDFENCLPYSHIDKVPAHQYPEEYIRSFGPDYIMAQVSQEIGIEVLITGQGGDNLFGDAIYENPTELKWMPHTYYEGWSQDLIYAPAKIELVPFYGYPKISELIYNLRFGHNEDITKIWARQFFKDFLPKELVTHCYRSDFWGLVISGVQQLIPHLPLMFEKTYELTKNNYFHKDKVKEILKIDFLDHTKENYMIIEPLIGISVWIDSLVRGGIIKN